MGDACLVSLMSYAGLRPGEALALRWDVGEPSLVVDKAEKRLEHLATAVPYDCRGSFVSLHLRAGASPLKIAAWAGH